MLLVAVAIAPRTSALAQDNDRVAALIEANSWSMSSSDGEFSGAGADFLRTAAREAEFVVLGERHGTQEIPALTSWLLRDLRPAGFDTYAVEVGPRSAEILRELAMGPDPIQVFDNFIASSPFTVPFFDAREEAQALVDAVEAGYAIWGLDQEFIGSGRLHLARLRELAPNAEAAALIDSWWEREMRGLAHFQRTQSTEQAIFFTLTGDDVEQLRGAFGNVHEALFVIDELAASAHVYQLFGAGENYRSNYERIRLMKRHLNEYIQAPGGPDITGGGKVFIKLGAMHGGRGHSPLHQLDVGNQAYELAAVRGGSSLNIVVAGHHFAPTNGEVRDVTANLPALEKVFTAAADSAWSVVDLRALRPLLHTRSGKAGNEELAETAWAYDVVVVVNTLHAASPLGE